MDSPTGSLKQQIAERIKEANNVLVTVSSNPTVDQLAATIGLTLLLNKLGKHGTAVFSGKVPSTIEFLEPEKTIEKNTDSLRDFIIALDKSKADKLRYKVEDKLVKIFITPYRTSLSEKDVEFSQGDFNVDVVIALGVKQKEQLDQAITSHGRILHDATVISINTDAGGDIGTMNWVDNAASSLCEMVVALVDEMHDANLFDGQMSTALLTGIVAQTERFSNSRTSPTTMSFSSKLMASGANQQLIANKLQEKPKETTPSATTVTSESHNPDGTLSIDHGPKTPDIPKESSHSDEKDGDYLDQIQIDEHGTLIPKGDTSQPIPKPGDIPKDPKIILSPPTLGGTLTANSRPEGLDPSTDAMTLPPVNSPLLHHDSYQNNQITSSVPSINTTPPTVAPSNLTPIQPSKDENKPVGFDDDSQTLTQLEKFVNSPHLSQSTASAQSPNVVTTEVASSEDTKDDQSSLEAARSAVDEAIKHADVDPLQPIAALNANPMDLDLGHQPSPVPQPAVIDSQNTDSEKIDLPEQLIPTAEPTDNTKSSVTDPTAPPPVPPPMMPPAFGAPIRHDDQSQVTPPVL